MRCNVKKYVKERDQMLRKGSVEELRKFVNSHKENYSEDYIKAFNEASDEVLEVTLHKMIVNVTSMPEAMRSQSAIWLVTRGYSINIGG